MAASSLLICNSLIYTLSYLNVHFDLSKVIFVATSNRAQLIPPSLLRPVIGLPGYTSEKLRISMRHLIPRVLSQHGLNYDFLKFPEVCNYLTLCMVVYKLCISCLFILTNLCEKRTIRDSLTGFTRSLT